MALWKKILSTSVLRALLSSVIRYTLSLCPFKIEINTMRTRTVWTITVFVSPFSLLTPRWSQWTLFHLPLRMSGTFSYHFHFEFEFEWLADDNNNSKIGERTYYMLVCVWIIYIFCSLLSSFNSMTRRDENRLTSIVVFAMVNAEREFRVSESCTGRTVNQYEATETWKT